MIDTEFRRSLAELGLGQYYDLLVAEAFDSWQILAQITEQDLDALNVKLGHRRILQRAIAEYKQRHQQIDSQSTGDSIIERSLVPLAPCPAPDEAKLNPRGKRKYVRHPKVDANAPSLAPTGYVLFSNWVRDGLRHEKYDFPELAKIVGRKWKALPEAERAGFLNQSKELKSRYLRQLAQYKRTPHYREYQKYLADFRTRNIGVPHSHKHSRSPRLDGVVLDDEPKSCRSRSESTTGDWPVVDLPPALAPMQQSHGLPSMQVKKQDTCLRSVPILSPISGHGLYGNAAVFPMAHSPTSPSNDRCLQPPVHNMQARRLPPLVPSFRT